MDGLDAIVADTLRWAEAQLTLVIAELEVTAALAQESQHTIDTALGLQSTALEHTRRHLNRLRAALGAEPNGLDTDVTHGASRYGRGHAAAPSAPVPCARESERRPMRSRTDGRRPPERGEATSVAAAPGEQ